METIRRLNNREVHIIAGAVYEFLDSKFSRQTRGAKNRMAQSIAQDIIDNFNFNSGLDAVREAGEAPKAIKAGVEWPKSWKINLKS